MGSTDGSPVAPSWHRVSPAARPLPLWVLKVRAVSRPSKGRSEVDAQRSVVLSSGVRVPYPEPTSAAASTIGTANRRADTVCEVRLRSALHRLGLRFRKDLLLRVRGIRVHPDVVFTSSMVAIFVDGCFWHSCPLHGRIPKSNQEYWVPKLQANVDRDRRVDAALRADGWYVARIWEHEDPAVVAAALEPVIRTRSAAKSSTSARRS